MKLPYRAFNVAIAGFLLFAGATPVDASEISAAEYLAAQPKPRFKDGHTLPHLSRFGWSLPFQARVELAREWGYALEFSGRAKLESLEKQLRDPDSDASRICALAASDPDRYPLAVVMDRDFPSPVPADFWVRDAEGRLTDGKNTTRDINDATVRKVPSPEAPDEYWETIAEHWARPLAMIAERAPVAIVLNGGEYGIGTPRAAVAVWDLDPKVRAARGNRSWYDYASQRKAHHELIVARAARAAVPGRELYVYYNTTGESYRRQYGRWQQNSFDSSVLRIASDLPSFQSYFRHFNTGWTGSRDLLSMFLNSVGFHEGLGASRSYNWLCAGWVRGGSDDLAEIPRYIGFLKCLYTAGMLGGNAGYYTLPPGGFGVAFAPENPPHWLQQITALAHVHALFSHLEKFIREGDLLPGPDRHRWSRDQAAYEFPTGESHLRVLARKLRASDEWLITAWAAAGDDRPVTVKIPGLETLTLQARASGAVYHADLVAGKPRLVLLDRDGVLPSESVEDRLAAVHSH